MDSKKTAPSGSNHPGGVEYSGLRVSRGSQEMEDDFLEEIYRQWLNGASMGLDDIVIRLGDNKARLRSLARKLVGYRYITIDDNERISLTDLGKMRGKECLERHQKLTVFFQMIGGMDEREAEEDACRVEHTISRKAMDGIARFITEGDINDRHFSNIDLSALFEPGTYEMAMEFYEIERRHPRVLAKEWELFEPYVSLEVTQEGASLFRIKPKENDAAISLWYRRADEWIEAPRDNGCFWLHTYLFDYTVSAAFPVTEGTLVTAVTKKGTVPIVLDSREINVHVI